MDKYNDILEKIRKFRDDRDWMKFHSPKNMAISIVLEATELLEHFQWKDGADVDAQVQKKKKEIEEEIADICVYVFELADNLNIDVFDVIEKKLVENDKKYPINKAKGISTKYTELN